MENVWFKSREEKKRIYTLTDEQSENLKNELQESRHENYKTEINRREDIKNRIKQKKIKKELEKKEIEEIESPDMDNYEKPEEIQETEDN
jgi:hypothetical protein